MSSFADHLWQDLVRDHGPELARAGNYRSRRWAVVRRPRVLAAGTLGFGAAVAAIVLAAGGTPAYAVTTSSNGSILVTLNQTSALPQVNAKLASMGVPESISIQMGSGTAPVAGFVTCSPAPGVSGPTVEVLNGSNGTDVIPSGNTGAGTWYLASCTVYSSAGSGGQPAAGNS